MDAADFQVGGHRVGPRGEMLRAIQHAVQQRVSAFVWAGQVRPPAALHCAPARSASQSTPGACPSALLQLPDVPAGAVQDLRQPEQVRAAVDGLLALLLGIPRHGEALAAAAREAVQPGASEGSAQLSPAQPSDERARLPAGIGQWLLHKVLLDEDGWDVGFSQPQCAPAARTSGVWGSGSDMLLQPWLAAGTLSSASSTAWAERPCRPAGCVLVAASPGHAG